MDTNTALTTARADLAELAARINPILASTSRTDIRELNRARRLVIDLEAARMREVLAA